MMQKSPVYICRFCNLSEYEENNCFCHISLNEKDYFIQQYFQISSYKAMFVQSNKSRSI